MHRSLTREIMVPETHDLDTKSDAVLARARQIVISTAEENLAAALFLRGLKTLQLEIVARFEPAKSAAHQAHRKICDLEAQHVKPLKEAEAIVKKAMSAWMVEQEIKRKKEQEKITKQELKQGKDELTILPQVETPSGVCLRETWTAEVRDFSALIKAVAADKLTEMYLLPNQKLLDQQARVLKGELRIPGVVPVKTTGMAASAIM